MNHKSEPQREFRGQDVRQGEIILRAVFIAGLGGFLLLVLLLSLVGLT